MAENNYEQKPELLNLPVANISLGDRARQKYSDLQSLADDIKTKGLIHPIAVQRTLDDPNKYVLLAGGRRLSASILGGIPSLPCRIYPATLSDLDRREIELMENVSRQDLTWPEQVWLTDEIHRLHTSKYGEAQGSSPGHSASDTAKILNVSPMSVSRDRKLKRGLEVYGDELLTAKTKSQALRRLDRLEQRDSDKKAAAKILSNDEWDDQVRKTLAHGFVVDDFLRGVKSVPDHAVDLVEIDPPYGIDLNKVKQGDDKELYLSEYEDVAGPEYLQFMHQVLVESSRVASQNSWLLCWCGYQWLNALQDMIRELGWLTGPIPLFWYKPNRSQTNHPELYLGSAIEPCIYARRGMVQISNQGRSNVFTFNSLDGRDKGHPTERPIEMITAVLKTFLRPNQRVMVPFLGSGNTLLAANNVLCSGFGFDLSEDYRNYYLRRVAEGTLRAYQSYTKPAGE